MEDTRGVSAALDVAQEETAICVVDQDGAILAEAKVPTCPETIADGFAERVTDPERVGMETGPLARVALERADRSAGGDCLP